MAAEKLCVHCGTAFVACVHNARFCSRRCQGTFGSRQWRAANRERDREAKRRRRAADPERELAQARARRAADPERACAQSRARYAADPERSRAQGRAYRALYRAAELNATPPWQSRDELAAIWAACPDGYAVDHIHPLKGKLSCGLNVAYNLQYLPASVNTAKSNRRPPPGYLDWFDHDAEKPSRAAGPGEWSGWPEEYYEDGP